MNVLHTDLHVHVGNERRGVPAEQFVSALGARGVTLAGLLDHAEFYYPNNNDWIITLVEQFKAQKIDYYPLDITGLQRLYADVAALRRPGGMKLVRGLEFNNAVTTPESFLELPDYLCFCFGGVGDMPGDTWGVRAANRIRQAAGRINRAGKPGIINHPFRSRSWVYNELLKAGGPLPRVEEHITPDDVKAMVAAARETGLSLEVNLNDLTTNDPPAQRPVLDLLIHAYSLAAAEGANFSVGSDSHSVPAATFSPAVGETLSKAGITEANLRHILKQIQYE